MGERGKAPAPVEIAADMRREWTVEADFVSAIRNGTPVYPNFAQGVSYMEFMEAVALSMERGETIRLPL